MKMKDVCARTGLSDRTVRFYMEEKLIAPSYTENYLGRRAFEFSETDVKNLQDIAVLRKFGFTIEEIFRLQETPGSSGEILTQLRERKQKTVDEEQAALHILNRLDTGKSYDVAELAQALSAPAQERKLPAEEQSDRLSRRRKLRMLAFCGAAAAPVILPWFWFNWNISSWSGLGLMRQPFLIGSILTLCILFAGTERHAALLRLGGAVLTLADYVLAFVFFQERANIAGAVDLTTSLRAARWTYWLACIWLLIFIIRWLIDSAVLLKRE